MRVNDKFDDLTSPPSTVTVVWLSFVLLFVQKKTADDFVASNDEESDEEEVGVDEEGNEIKKPKVKKEKKRWVKEIERISIGCRHSLFVQIWKLLWKALNVSPKFHWSKGL